MGTGLAQPMMNPPMVAVMMKTSVPMGSRCLMGFRVSRPAILAVGSPNQYETRPWATSWQVTARRKGTAIMLMRRTLSDMSNMGLAD